MNFNNPDEFSSSPVGSAGSDASQQSPTTEIVDGSELDSDDDKDTVIEGTVTGIVNDDMTGHSEASEPSEKVSNGQLLSQHSPEAPLNGDQTGEVSMDLTNDVTSEANDRLLQQNELKPISIVKLQALQDQENINPFSPAFGAGVRGVTERTGEAEMTMEMTHAVGEILQLNVPRSPARGRRKSNPSSRLRSSSRRRRSSGDSSTLTDETMEFATVYGGIAQSKTTTQHEDVDTDENEDEEMTMEMTAVIGGVVQPEYPILPTAGTEQSQADDEVSDTDMDMEMDMTAAVGRVLSPVTERTEPSENGTMNMDITKAVVSILP